ncbi:MAG TPA: GNAT family N-acetyltransferase [Acidimicrobiia bacterium]|nr:GNAT family N-acetyltransferase [Acidimicrobiia bacterium]
MEPLDNPAWHSLAGPQGRFAQGNELARRYDPEVSVFAAVPDEPTATAWEALRDLVGPGAVALLVRSELDAPPEWEVVFRGVGLQFRAPDGLGRDAVAGRFDTLGPDDAPEMLALVERTRPGPFTKRTVELGTYVGERNAAGALVAMAGERMHPPGFTEISAVCTEPEHQGRGLATALMHTIAAGIRARGEQPFLHTAGDNARAIALYEHLGFVRRASLWVMGVRAPR